MKLSYYLAIIFLTLFIYSCGEKGGSPQDSEIKGKFSSDDKSEVELLKSTLGYISSEGFEIKSITTHKVINLKNGDRFYYIEYKKAGSKNGAIAIQFAGTYKNVPKNIDNVVIISCDNDGACPECLLSVEGDCAVMSCSCQDKSGLGSYDCNLNYNEVDNFKSQYMKKGNDIVKKIEVPELLQANCSQY